MSALPLGPAGLSGQQPRASRAIPQQGLRQPGTLSTRLQHSTRLRASQPGSNNPKGGREWLQTLLSRFGPMTERAQNTAVLDFEKPLVELDNRINQVSGPRSQSARLALLLLPPLQALGRQAIRGHSQLTSLRCRCGEWQRRTAWT